MGLDMYLKGEKFHWTDWKNPENNLEQDGFKVTKTILEIGYWRKHPNLHGFIVKTFADGVDECQDIDLDEKDLQTIKDAVVNDNLILTEGFFFGKSSDRHSEDKEEAKWGQQEYDETIEIFDKATSWLGTEEKGVSRSIEYRASW